MVNRNGNFETCPVCGKDERDPKHPMCRRCNEKVDARFDKADSDGDIILVTRMEFARIKGAETVVRLKKELVLAEQGKERLYPKAREQTKVDLKAEGAITINKQEFNRRVGRKFGELLGHPDRAKEIWDYINNHPNRIASIENFLNQEEDPASSEVKEGRAVA